MDIGDISLPSPEMNMSSGIIMGTIDSLSKVPKNLSATINNNCAELAAAATTCAELASASKSSLSCMLEQKEDEVPKEDLHKYGKQARAKLLADGYTKGKLD